MTQPALLADNASDETASGRRPADSAKHGNVEIAIWRNNGTNGDFYSASAPAIRYNENGEWKDGSAFSRHDLLDLAEAAREAATKIRDLNRGRGRGGPSR